MAINNDGLGPELIRHVHHAQLKCTPDGDLCEYIQQPLVITNIPQDTLVPFPKDAQEACILR